jgi:hypothetical protein
MRVAGAALGGVGVLLAASTTVWPTRVFAVRAPEVGDFTKGYEQRIWSWGRQVVYSSDGVLLDAFGGPSPVARLVLLVVVLVLAAAGLLAWVVIPGRRGELMVAVGLGVALATVTGSIVERVSFNDRSMGPQPGLVDVTTTAAWLEVGSVGVLAVTLALVVIPVVLPGPSAALEHRVALVLQRFRAPRVETPPRADAPPGSPKTPSVGFSDDPE